MRVRVSLNECDDTTEMDIDVTSEQLAFLQMLAKLSEATSSYQCMPTLSVREVKIK